MQSPSVHQAWSYKIEGFALCLKHTKSSAMILMSPTELKMASKRDFPGPTYCQLEHHLGVVYIVSQRSWQNETREIRPSIALLEQL